MFVHVLMLMCADGGQKDNLGCFTSGAECLIFEKGFLISLELTY